MLHDRRTPVGLLSFHVFIISYWWGKFEIHCNALYVNHANPYTFMTVRSVVSLMRATWTRHKCLTYFGLWRFDTRSMYYFYTRAYENTWGAFHQAFCQCFSLTNIISYWNPCYWFAESKVVSEKHWQNAWWNAPLADTTSAHARGAWFRTLRCVSKGDRTVWTKFESAFIPKLSEITAWNFDSW